jgi:tetratricopeptide (TPR) repeat protein
MLFSQQNAQAATTWLGTEQLEVFWQVMEFSAEPRNRLKAASAAANLSGILMDPYAARRSYELAQRIGSLSQDDDLMLSCLKAVLAMHCGNRAASLGHLKAAIDVVARQRFADSTAVRVHTGLGVHAQLGGRYEEAISHHLTAYRLAQGLGNDSLIRSSCLNLAVCYGRLGQPLALIEWTDKGKALLPPAFAGNSEVQLLYWKALGHAQLAQADAAGAALSFVDARLPCDVPTHMWRLWQLMKADVLTMLDKRDQAVNLARTALQYHGDMTPVPHYVGLFTRWAAVAAGDHSEDCAVARLTLSLQPNLGELAALDAAEVLAATALVRRRLGFDITMDNELLNYKLLELPPAVAQQLLRFGVLNDNGATSAPRSTNW